MRLELTNNANCAVAKLDGELDEGCVKEVREKIDKFIAGNRFGQFVFDFAGVSFMDSTGIGMLLGRYKNLKQLGIPIYISNARGHVDFILSTAGIYTIMKKIS
ncbi:MAG: STAS domain-containing protein [Clostridia bacterium]|nr:STAS domain-containing protein [Clostridia bacterium]